MTMTQFANFQTTFPRRILSPTFTSTMIVSLQPSMNLNLPSNIASVGTKSSLYSHSVCRSAELLSCAKTALKLAKRQHASDDGFSSQQHEGRDYHHNQFEWWSIPVEDLRLFVLLVFLVDEVLEDAVDLLRGMNGELKTLEGLVRRRGHTNDPTEEIQLSTQRLEEDTQQLMTAIKQMVPPTARGQYL